MMSDNKVLLVIDLQTGFCTANDPTLIKIVNIEIEKAKKENIPIICLNYTGIGDVIQPIKCNLDGYKKLHIITKNRNDGGKEVLTLFNEIKFDSGEVTAIGVNTDACVRETVETLAKNSNYKINLVSNGCNSWTWRRHWNQISEFTDDKKIRVYYTIHKKPHRYVMINRIRRSMRISDRKFK
jgi:nicotinamidase-related amidase